MKTMKLFSMAAVALLMAACSNSDDFDVQKPAETAGVYHFEATIAAPNADASMRTVYTEEGSTINVKWAVGDQIALVHNGVVDVATVTAVDVSGNATIEATITGTPADNDDVTLAYPADAVSSAEPSALFPSFPFTPKLTSISKLGSQDGTLEFIQNNLDLRMSDGKLAVSGDKATLKGSVSIPSLICIWKLTLQDNASTPLDATKLTVKYGTSTQARATSTGKSAYYLAFVPSMLPSGDLTIEATVGSDTYTYTKTGTVSLTAGKFYQSTVKMAKAGPTIVTWSPVNFNGSTYTQDGVTLTPSNSDAVLGPNFYAYGDKTFTTTLGKFTKIEIVCTYSEAIDGWTKEKIGAYQPYPEDPDYWENIYKLTWTGNAESVTIQGKSVHNIQSITFTIQ